MKYLVAFSLVLSLLLPHQLIAQNSSKKETSSFKFLEKPAIPIALVGLAMLATNSTFEKNLNTTIRNYVGQDFSYKIDDYTQYIPIAQLYASKTLGYHTEKHWFEQTKHLTLSNIVSSTIAISLKRLLNKRRPDGDKHAFPSGHTMFAFTNAAVLQKEYEHTNKLWANSGYISATVTGGFRILNNRHWLSDVLVGAGLGIIATELVYYFNPLKKFNPFKASKKIRLTPTSNATTYSLLFTYDF